MLARRQGGVSVPESKPIGRVVRSSSHTDYVCRIFDDADQSPAPVPADYPFGGFVRLGDAIGVIYRSELLNPDYAVVGPRLSASESVRQIVTPDLIHERATLVGILLLGEGRDGQAWQGVPGPVVPVHSVVTTLADPAFLAFHRDPGGRLQVRYYPLLLSQTGPIGPSLLLTILTRLEGLVSPEEQALLRVLRTSVNWQTTMAGT